MRSYFSQWDIEIKWFRNRNQFDWNGITVCLDYTKGFGHVIELEIMSDDQSKERNTNLLKQKLAELQIELTPKEKFDEHYNYTKQNWKQRFQKISMV